jgi:hypothetical protein
VLFLFSIIFISKEKIMAKINEVHSIIIKAENANLSTHTFTEVYGGPTGCTMTLNGVSNIQMGGSSSIYVLVNSISGGVGCYLLGNDANVAQGSPNVN